MTVVYTLAALVVLAGVAALGAVIYANWCHYKQSGPLPAPMMGDARNGDDGPAATVGGPSPVPPSQPDAVNLPPRREAGRFHLHAARNVHRD